MSATASDFWNFSLRIYAQPKIADACLDLQDRFGADVNLVLFMLWAAAQERRLDPMEIEKVALFVENWRKHIIAPLRLARRALKAPPRGWPVEETESLRQRVKADELEAERLQQDAMSAFFAIDRAGRSDSSLAAAKSNLGNYASRLGAAFPEKHIVDLANSITA
jgi:uncharacterized protein (TIGR02444 family)